MSQVDVVYETSPLREYLVNTSRSFDHVLVVKSLHKVEVFVEIKFPKETHYAKTEDSVYQEFVEQYEVIRVLDSPCFKGGDRFCVWEEPAYDLEAIQIAHEQGFVESPSILKRKPQYPIEGDAQIVFIRSLPNKKNEKISAVFGVVLREGLKAEKEILAILGKKKAESKK